MSMKRILIVVCVLAGSVASAVHAADCVKNAYGQVVCGKGQCATDQYGAVSCAKEGGGAIRDSYGAVRCGVGACAKDDTGRVMCSAKPGGGAGIDSYGKVKCLGECEEGTPQRCEAPR